MDISQYDNKLVRLTLIGIADHMDTTGGGLWLYVGVLKSLVEFGTGVAQQFLDVERYRKPSDSDWFFTSGSFLLCFDNACVSDICLVSKSSSVDLPSGYVMG